MNEIIIGEKVIDHDSVPFIIAEAGINHNGEIKKAIEQIFKVKVIKVNTAIVHGKLKSFKGNLGYKKDFKKAIVTLAEGSTIDTSLEIK